MDDEEILEYLNWMKDARLRPDELQMVVYQISHQMNVTKKLTPEVIAMITQRIIETHLYTKVINGAMPQARTYEREKVLKEVFETWKCDYNIPCKEENGNIMPKRCSRCKLMLKLVGI